MLYTKELDLAIGFMDTLSERLGTDGCNDWNFPPDWTREEIIKFVKEYHEYNGDPHEFNEHFLHLPNYAVAAFLSYKLALRDESCGCEMKNPPTIK